MPALLEMLRRVRRRASAGAPALPLRLVLLSGDWIPVQPARRGSARWCPRRAGDQPGRRHRGLDLVDPLPDRRGRPGLAQHPLRPAAGQPDASTCWTSALAAVPGVGAGRAVHRRRRAWRAGYWRDPERTREQLRHAIRAPGERLYRTGDLGPLPARRQHRVPRPRGLPGQDPAATASSWARSRPRSRASADRASARWWRSARARPVSRRLVGWTRAARRGPVSESPQARGPRLSRAGRAPLRPADHPGRRCRRKRRTTARVLRARRVFGAQAAAAFLGSLHALEVLRRGRIGLAVSLRLRRQRSTPCRPASTSRPGRVDGAARRPLLLPSRSHALVPVSVHGRSTARQFTPRRTGGVRGARVLRVPGRRSRRDRPLYGADSDGWPARSRRHGPAARWSSAAEHGLGVRASSGRSTLPRSPPRCARRRHARPATASGRAAAPTAEQEAGAASSPPLRRHDQQFGERLAAALREKLPAYMVPSAFVRLDAAAAHANGKVDRTALPAPQCQRRPRGRMAPGSELERASAAICGARCSAGRRSASTTSSSISAAPRCTGASIHSRLQHAPRGARSACSTCSAIRPSPAGRAPRKVRRRARWPAGSARGRAAIAQREARRAQRRAPADRPVTETSCATNDLGHAHRHRRHGRPLSRRARRSRRSGAICATAARRCVRYSRDDINRAIGRAITAARPSSAAGPRGNCVGAASASMTSTTFDAAFFGFTPARGRADRSAAAAVPGVRVGGAGGRRLRPRRAARGRSASSAAPAEHATAHQPAAEPRAASTRSALLSACIGNEQRLPRHARLLQARPARPERERADRVLDLARGGSPRLPEPARRASATWRSPAASRSTCRSARLPLRGRRHRSRPTATAAPSTRAADGTVFGERRRASWC